MHVIPRRRLATHLDVRSGRQRRQRPATARAFFAVQINPHPDAPRASARKRIDDATVGQDKPRKIDGAPRAVDQPLVYGTEAVSGTVKHPHAGDDGLGRKNPGRLRLGRQQKSDERGDKPEG